MTPWSIRRADAADIPGLLALRRGLFHAMGYEDEASLATMEAACRAYFQTAIPDRSFIGWVAEAQGSLVGTAGLVIHQVPPTARNPSGRVGYVMNMYTLPDWRRRGIARSLLRALLEYLHDEGIVQASLHATDEGRPLYEQAGFADSREMRLWFPSGKE
jgi:GNAT superfamily N-acetyltransferase